MRGMVAIRMLNSVVKPIILISLLSVAVLISKKSEKGDNIRKGDGSRKSEPEGTRRGGWEENREGLYHRLR